jgi:peptidoglycan hydrolase-like protein with peptidoglycan-binding domain
MSLSTRSTATRGVVAGLVGATVLWCSCGALADSGGAGLGGAQTPGQGSTRSHSSRAVFARTLRKGQSGADVRTLQVWLAQLGYHVVPTGRFDAGTKTAVRSFQLVHHLHPASGSVGRRTAAALLTAVQGLISIASVDSAVTNPIPGFRIGRDDMGVDGEARAGAPIYSPLPSKLVQVMRDWYAGQPLLLYRFLNPPPGVLSDYWYVAEQVKPVTTRIGSTFVTGEKVATFARSGTGIEIGWGSPTSNSRTLADETDPGSAGPPNGAKTIWGETFKQFFGIK